MIPITRWDRYVYNEDIKQWRWEFNHIEDGHSNNDSPTPKTSEQIKSWGGKTKWFPTHCWLNDSIPPKIIYTLT